MVCAAQCFAPFNAETPHSLLASRYLTPASLHFVRNHLPVPKHMDEAAYRRAGLLSAVISSQNILIL